MFELSTTKKFKVFSWDRVPRREMNAGARIGGVLGSSSGEQAGARVPLADWKGFEQ
jgi:hypothetical protein